MLIDFGQLTVGATRTLTLDLTSVGSTVTLGSTTAVQPDSEFTLPFVSGTAVGATPVAVAMTFSPTSAGTKTAIFQLTDYSPGAAVVVIQLTGNGVPAGLTVVPNPVDVGQVEINQTQSVAVTITNSSSLPANFTLSPLQGQDPKPFTLGPPSATALTPNASATLNVVFAPLMVGSAGASFTVNGSDSAPVTVNLAGIGASSWIEVVSPLDFGFVQLGNTVVKPALIKNASSFATLYLVAPAPNISQPAGSNAFSLTSASPTLPLALAPGQAAAVQVAFAPGSLDAFTGTLFFTSDDPREPYPAIQLEGYGGGPQIQCQPRLSFGPTPVGYPFPEPALCTNTGANIPSHPELKLQIAQSGLSTDAPFFSARLSLPDGGLAGPNDSVALSSGQTATIEVSFAPQDAGVYEGRLAVASNDTYDLDAGTLLTGQGIVPGACILEAMPNEVIFGDVPPRRGVGAQSLLLVNAGQNLCDLSHIALDPRSAAGFSLPQGDLDDQLLSYPGDPDNPAGRPSVLSIPVQFATTVPRRPPGRNHRHLGPQCSPPQSHRFSDRQQRRTGCFTVAPTSDDFGTVYFSPVTEQICTPTAKIFTGINGCGVPRCRLQDRARAWCGWWRSARFHPGSLRKHASDCHRSRQSAHVSGLLHARQPGTGIGIPAGQQQRPGQVRSRRIAQGGRRARLPSHRHLHRSHRAEGAGPGVDPRRR